MRKTVIALLGLCLSSAALADSGKATIFNTSADHYMTVTYAFCDYDGCTKPETIDIFSAKASGPTKKNYVEVETPITKNFNVKTVRILKAVEKQIIKDKPTDIVVAQTKSNPVCDVEIGETTTPIVETDGVLELNDMNGSPLIVCKRGFV